MSDNAWLFRYKFYIQDINENRKSTKVLRIECINTHDGLPLSSYDLNMSISSNV